MDKRTVQIMNKCRKYLHAITLSDITNGYGNSISQNFIDGNRDPNRVSNFNWSPTTRPSLNEWLIWKQNLRSLFCTSDFNNTLKNPLGRNIIHGNAIIKKMMTYYTSKLTSIIVYIKNQHAVVNSIDPKGIGTVRLT